MKCLTATPGGWHCDRHLTLARTWGGDATPPPTPQTVFLGCTLHFCDRHLIFCIACFLTFLHKVCKLQGPMTFNCLTMTLFSRSCHDPFDANAYCCGSFQLFFDIHDKCSYPWRLKCMLQWIKYNCRTVTSMQVIWRHHVWRHHMSRKHLRQ